MWELCGSTLANWPPRGGRCAVFVPPHLAKIAGRPHNASMSSTPAGTTVRRDVSDMRRALTYAAYIVHKQQTSMTPAALPYARTEVIAGA
jgi:hypothetical protein